MVDTVLYQFLYIPQVQNLRFQLPASAGGYDIIVCHTKTFLRRHAYGRGRTGWPPMPAGGGSDLGAGGGRHGERTGRRRTGYGADWRRRGNTGRGMSARRSFFGPRESNCSVGTTAWGLSWKSSVRWSRMSPGTKFSDTKSSGKIRTRGRDVLDDGERFVAVQDEAEFSIPVIREIGRDGRFADRIVVDVEHRPGRIGANQHAAFHTSAEARGQSISPKRADFTAARLTAVRVV